MVCTHLHPDHVGWNTLLENGRWVPTFPNARYVFSARDWEWLDEAPVTPLGDYAGDSVRPVIEAGLADLVRPDFRLTENSPARKIGIDLSRPFRLNGVEHQPLPGMRPGYFSGDRPDAGAIQYGAR